MIDLSGIHTVGVGTANPMKVAAVKSLFNKLGLDAEVSGFNTKSNVSEMPLSKEETMKGSYNRAFSLIQEGLFDMAFGLEGGVEFTTLSDGKPVCMLFGWTTIIDSEGYVSSGSSGMFPIPGEIAFALEGGAELGEYMSEKTGIKNMKQKGGTIGFLSHELISRQSAFENASIKAIIPWLNKDLYE